MHWTNVPTILSSLTFVLPFYAAVDTQNPLTALCWGALTTTSIALHSTKHPFHLHGPGNCIPVLLQVDTFALYVALARSFVDGYAAGPLGVALWIGVVLWGGLVYHLGRLLHRFGFDRRPDISILSHVSLHLISSFAGTAAIYSRAFKNGQCPSP